MTAKMTGPARVERRSQGKTKVEWVLVIKLGEFVETRRFADEGEADAYVRTREIRDAARAAGTIR